MHAFIYTPHTLGAARRHKHAHTEEQRQSEFLSHQTIQQTDIPNTFTIHA